MSDRVPDFLVIGAAKSGTTSLCHYLAEHPDVFVSREKESHFFLYDGAPPAFRGPADDGIANQLAISDREQYLRCFRRSAGTAVAGEASVYYLYRPQCLERALEMNPSMRFVAILRNPITRAFSAWSHHRRDGLEPIPDFLEALDAEQERIAEGWSYGWHYESVGRYDEQLAAARRIVPADQLHVVLYDDLHARPRETLRELFSFVGVDDRQVDTSLVLNASGQPRLRLVNRLLTQQNPLKEVVKKVVPYRLGNRAAHRIRNWNLRGMSLTTDERLMLEDRYRESIVRLAGLLGRDLDPWLNGEEITTGPVADSVIVLPDASPSASKALPST